MVGVEGRVEGGEAREGKGEEGGGRYEEEVFVGFLGFCRELVFGYLKFGYFRFFAME